MQKFNESAKVQMLRAYLQDIFLYRRKTTYTEV